MMHTKKPLDTLTALRSAIEMLKVIANGGTYSKTTFWDAVITFSKAVEEAERKAEARRQRGRPIPAGQWIDNESGPVGDGEREEYLNDRWASSKYHD